MQQPHLGLGRRSRGRGLSLLRAHQHRGAPGGALAAHTRRGDSDRRGERALHVWPLSWSAGAGWGWEQQPGGAWGAPFSRPTPCWGCDPAVTRAQQAAARLCGASPGLASLSALPAEVKEQSAAGAGTPQAPAAQKSGLLSPRCMVCTPLNDAAREGLRKSIGKAVLATCCSRRRQPAGGGRQNGCPLLGGAATRGARAPSLARLQQPCYVVTQPPALGTSVANYECSWLRLVLHARCRQNWRGTRAAANASEQTQYMTMRARPMLKAWKAGMG